MTDRSSEALSGAERSTQGNRTAPSVRWVAHRGWSSRFAENSLAAFGAAVAAGADEIEFDVRHSSDGVPVVLHDPVVDRVSTLRGPVASFTAAELRAATITAHGASFPNMGLASLEQVLDLFAPHVGMNIHVKTLGDEAATLGRIADAATRHPNRHIYIAGDEEVLEAAIRVCPAVPRCCLARQREPAALLAAALRYACSGLQYRVNAHDDPEAVAEAKARGLFRNMFYADTPADAQRAIALGIDGVLTNDVGFVMPQVRG